MIVLMEKFFGLLGRIGRKASGFLVDSTDNIYVGGTDNSIEESQKFHLVKFSESNEGSWSLTMSPEGGKQ